MRLPDEKVTQLSSWNSREWDTDVSSVGMIG